MKKIALIFFAGFICMTMSACTDEPEISDVEFEISYEIGETGWNKTLLSRAALDNIEEPEGTKTFSEDENGNVLFTITPSTASSLRKIALAIHSEIGNISDKCEPRNFEEALDTDTHFKLNYYIPRKAGKKNVVVEMNLEGDVIKGTINFS